MSYWEFRGNTVRASDLSDAVFLAIQGRESLQQPQQCLPSSRS